MPSIKNDLGELWGDFKESMKDYWTLLTDPKEAPPTIRKQDLAVARITKVVDGKTVDIGTFVPELYELALEGNLEAQFEEKEWKKLRRGDKREQPFYDRLFREDGTRKTAFELAMLSYVLTDGNDKALRKCEAAAQREFAHLKKHNLRLPLPIFKYRIKPDYLKNAQDQGLLEVAAVRDIKVNRSNPKIQLPVIETTAHYIAQRAAFIATFADPLS